MKDFFISYNKADQKVAEWVGWVLEEAGYSVVLQSWDFRPGENFILKMHRASTETRSTIALLSANYLASDFARQELAAALASDPQGRSRRLIPIRVGEFKPEGLLGSLVYADILGLPEEAARLVILQALDERGKPDAPPPFPAPAFEPQTGELHQGLQHIARVRPTRRLSCIVTFGVFVLFAAGLASFVSQRMERERTYTLIANADAQYRVAAPVVEDTRRKGLSLSQSLDAGSNAAVVEKTVGQTISEIDEVMWESQNAPVILAHASERNGSPELKEYISLKLRAAQITHEALLNYRNTLVHIRLDLSRAGGGDAAALARARDGLRDANLTYAALLVPAREFERLAADVAARAPDEIRAPRPD